MINLLLLAFLCWQNVVYCPCAKLEDLRKFHIYLFLKRTFRKSNVFL
jgi:hypothetical protein